MKKILKCTICGLLAVVMLLTMTACDLLNIFGSSKQYVITYIVDGEKFHLTVLKNSDYVISPIPQKDGYVFTGLFDAETGGTQFVTEKGISLSPYKEEHDILLFAQFEPKTYKLLLNSECPLGIEEIECKYGETIKNLPLNLVKNETTDFVGWFTSLDTTDAIQLSTNDSMLSQNAIVNKALSDLSDEFGRINLYAVFETKKVKVTFYSEDGATVLMTKNVDYGSSFTQIAPSILPDGTSVMEWTQYPHGAAVTSGIIERESSFYIKSCVYHIKLDKGNGETEKKDVKNGQSFSLEEPTREGYTFQGWYDNSGKDFPIGMQITPISSTTITAQWTANRYTIKFKMDDGMVLSAGTKTVVFDEPYTLPIPSRNGYLFSGWYVNDIRLTDQKGTSVDKWQFASDKTLTARWLKTTATYSENTRYKITDSGRENQHKDKVEFSSLLGASLSEYIAVGATKVSVYLKVNVAEIDDGYQYVFLSTDTVCATGSNAYLYGVEFEHVPGKKSGTAANYEFRVEISLSRMKDVIYIMYGASGTLDDDWYRNNIEATFTIS